ncbi:MAG: GlsB/YeaQ/YmgE family stress response membrane protein [candidate division KSB1 bacterium]|jgi:uncharacterized membrane protein YeaQ/YmgE (transglycosylase-associated protein family)|nr:GlsB/YeaQ/YmgE family stress response membrane protein [candidate division KSB1 bacterium]
MNIILFLIIGLAAGWLAGKIMKGKGFGLVGNLVVGCVGALLGGYLFDAVGLSAHGLIGSLIAALAGALIILWLLSKLRK